MQALEFEQLLTTFDMQSEFNPSLVMEQIRQLQNEPLSVQQQNTLQFLEAKSLATMNQFQKAADMAMECINQAILDRDYFVLAKCNVLQNYCYNCLNHTVSSGPYLELAMEYAQHSADLSLYIYTLTHHLIYLRGSSQFDKAQAESNKLLDLIKRVPVSYTTASALSQIASFYNDIHKWDLAAKYLKQAITGIQAIGNPVKELTMLSNLGSAYMSMKDFANAEQVLLTGLELSQQLEHQEQIILFYFNLGNLKIKAEFYRESLAFLDKGMEILKGLHNQPPMLFMDLYNNYSLCYWFLNKKELSLAYIDKAIAIANEMGLEREQIQIEVNKTNLLVDMGAYEEAKKILQRAIKYYKKQRANHQLIWVHRCLAQLYAKQHNYKKAYEINSRLDVITDDYIDEIMIKQSEGNSASMSQKAQAEFAYERTSPSASEHIVTQGFIGRSKAWQNVLNSALLAAQHQNTSVMIIGESGTGKEVIAQMIHKNSLRRHSPFIPVNVGAISSSLIESELFGHTKGAFTGATLSSKGYFLQADKGTLFLDEITEMPFDQQSKLLRALESRKIIPVGSSKEIPFDSRIISATNQNLRECLAMNKFRLDLYHRLNTIEIVIPPLRERPEDIEPIFLHYLDLYAKDLNKPKPNIDNSLFQMLGQYSFPGNARELKNIVERLYILSNSPQWDAQLLCNVNPFQFGNEPQAQGHDSNEEVNSIIRALIKAGGKQKDAAKILMMSEATLYRRIVKHGLQTYTMKGS